MNTLSLYGVLFYIIILFVLSAFCIKKALNSYAEFSFCGRSLTIVYVIFTYLGTWIGGGSIVGLVGQTYSRGAGQYWILGISFVVEIFFVFLFLTRIRKLEQCSIGGFFALRYPDYNQIIRIPVTIGILIRNVTMTGMQFSALAYMLTYVLDMDRNLAILLTFLVITSYTAISGLWGVVVTDIFQGILQTTGIILLVALTIKLVGGMDEIYAFYSGGGNEGFLNLLSFHLEGFALIKYILAFGLFFLISDQGDWERIYASKTNKIAFWGFLIPLVITLILLILPAYLGVFQRVLSLGQTNSEYIIYKFIFEVLGVKMAIFILIGLLAAIMSSADSFMLASGIIFSNDIIKRFVNKDASDKELIFWTRAFILVTGAIGFAFAINIYDILYLWITGIGMASIIMIPAYFSAWFSRRINTRGALCGMAFGLIYCGLIAIGCFPPTPDFILIGMVINFIFTVLVSFLTPPPSPEVISSTFYFSPKFYSDKKNINK